MDYVSNSQQRVITYFDEGIKDRMFEGETWKQVVDEIIQQLPEKVFISFDIDGLDPKLCPNTGTPVQGGFEAEQIFYLLRQVIKSGRKLIGFDLNEVGVGSDDWDANVGARVLYKLCNLMIKSNN
jgi:agmatinase